MVLIEYKASMFTARAKYSGDHILLRDEISTKLVRDSAENKRKGVEQLNHAIALLFSDPSRETVKDLDVSAIKRAYPLLVTLDDIGGSLLMSRLLNIFCAASFNPRGAKTVEVQPLFCTDVESLEVVLPYLGARPLAGFLQHWLDKDPKLIATLLAFLPDGLPHKRNEFLDKEWKALYEDIVSRLFPQEYAAQLANQPKG